MSYFTKPNPTSDYLRTRAELGRTYPNDRVTDEKLWADAKLRGKLGCRQANEVISTIDNLRSRGYR